MSSLAPLAGLFVAPVVALLVYLDATRRETTVSSRLLSASLTGAGSFVGFLVPAVFQHRIEYFYVRNVKPGDVIASSPYEAQALHLTIGIGLTALVLVVYWFGRR
ncbi:hypothetical protein [Natronobacterium texcoconense]|uniref:Uncharacterized protein n=1 Tax=Natronobacterium texcoconense TaxID=1095778 RepID=A0A1H1CAB9_NATTX|nr:hypothetical protein [Natronobacterium texcoconense]SDQ61141.1 hypothetical protein SAMN04489842_1332 [Natronobacterium texcoconense]